MKFALVLDVLLSAALYTHAAPTLDYRASQFTTHQYHPTFDAVPVGTTLGYHKGLHYSGFVVSTAENGVQPFPSPRIQANKRYAAASKARAASADQLPTIRSEVSGGKFRLDSFWWAASPYFGRNVTLNILGYDEGATSTDSLKYSGSSLSLVYNTGYNAGANGAQLQEAKLPSNFAFYAYRFNISDPVDAGLPTLYLDEFRSVTIVPS